MAEAVAPPPVAPKSEPYPLSVDAYLQEERIRVEVDIARHAEESARRSGATAEVPEDLAAEEAFADTAAARFALPPYDPDRNPADRLTHEDYLGWCRRRDQLLAQVDHAVAAERDYARERTDVEAPSPKEELVWIVGALGVVAVGFPVGVAVHDTVMVHVLGVGVRAIVGSVVAGVVIASVPVLGLLFSALHPQPKERWEGTAWFGLGLLFGVAVYLLRAWLAQSPADHLFAAAFAGMELLTVIAVKLYARSLHREVLDRRTVLRARSAADARVEAARAHGADREQEVARLELRIREHQRQVAERTARVLQAPLVRESARAAAHAGYRRSIARNRGYALDHDVHLPKAPEAK